MGVAPFLALTTALFTDPALSEPATYTPAEGSPMTVRVIRKTASADFRFEGTVVRSDAVTVKLNAADVPAPAEGDTLTLAGQTFTVQGAPTRIMRGAAWLVEAAP